jgi:hypothetical protein
VVVFWVCEEAVLGALVFSVYEEVVHALLCCVLFWWLLLGLVLFCKSCCLGFGEVFFEV